MQHTIIYKFSKRFPSDHIYYLKPKQYAYLIMEVRHWRSVSTFGSLPSFLAFFVFFCPFFPFFAENTPNQIRWGILRYSRWRERHSFVPGENTKKGKSQLILLHNGVKKCMKSNSYVYIFFILQHFGAIHKGRGHFFLFLDVSKAYYNLKKDEKIQGIYLKSFGNSMLKSPLAYINIKCDLIKAWTPLCAERT